jgi:hypothetical protein
MIQLKNQNGLIENVPTGFSWTTFFFGFFVPLFRGQMGYAAIVAVASIMTFGFAPIVFAFIINKHHAKNLIQKGYVPHSEMDRAYLVANGIIAPSPEPLRQAA